MENTNMEAIERNIEEARHYSKRAFMKITEYSLWTMTTWLYLYYIERKQGRDIRLLKVLKAITTFGLFSGWLSDMI